MGPSALKSGFDGRVVLCWIISKPSLRSWLLQESSFTAWSSLSSQHMRHTNLTFGESARAAIADASAAGDEVALHGDVGSPSLWNS